MKLTSQAFRRTASGSRSIASNTRLRSVLHPDSAQKPGIGMAVCTEITMIRGVKPDRHILEYGSRPACSRRRRDVHSGRRRNRLPPSDRGDCRQIRESERRGG